MSASVRAGAYASAMSSAPAYRGGGRGAAELACWSPSLRPANEAIAETRSAVVARAHDLVRNNGLFSGAVTNELEGIIGSGLRYVSRPDWKTLGLTEEWAKEFAAGVLNGLRLWSEDPDFGCDWRGVQNFPEIQRTSRRSLMITGDSLAIARYRRRPGALFGLQIQMVNADRLETPPGSRNDERIQNGVEVDARGRPVAYHIRNRHPGSRHGYRAGASRYARVAARVPGIPMRRQVLHTFHADEPDQNRGVSAFASILSDAKALTDYSGAEVKNALFNATLVASLESDVGPAALAALGATEDGLGDKGGQSASGLADYYANSSAYANDINLQVSGHRVVPLFPGNKLNVLKGSRDAASFEIFNKVAGYHLAAGLGQSVEELFRNHNQSYAASRAAMLQAWRSYRYETQFMGRNFLIPIIDLLVQEMIDMGMLTLPPNAPPYEMYKAAYLAGQILGPARGWPDPVKDAQGAKARVDAGIGTTRAEANENGLTLEEVLDAEKEEMDMRADRGLPPREREGLVMPDINAPEAAT